MSRAGKKVRLTPGRSTLLWLIRFCPGLLHLLWIYLSVYVRFLYWRMHIGRARVYAVESIHSAMKKQTLLLVRHGQTTWNVEHRLPGLLPGIPLNETGRQQVARLAEALTVLPISAIISSPLERALETAEILAKGRSLTIQQEPELRDTDVGPWAGKTIDEVAKSDPAWKEFVRDPTVAPEGVETFPQVQQRALAAIECWRMREDIGPYPTFVAHADVIKLLVAHYSGLDVARAGSIHIDNASVSLIELEEEHKPHVVAIGWSPHPGWLKSPIEEMLKKEGGVASSDDKAKQV